jgi:predicted LPLAT superfamily acyltransferase
VRGREHLDRVAREGRGALVLGSHLGSFDALRMIATTSPIPVRVLMYTRHATRINALFDRLAATSGESAARLRVIPVSPDSFEHVLEARRAIARGEVVAILADRTPPAERSRASRVAFLGAPAPIPQGPFRLAAALGVPVLFMVALRTGDARYEIDVELLADRIELPRVGRAAALDALCQSYADRLAAHCRRAPYQWFNFFDFWSDGSGAADVRAD